MLDQGYLDAVSDKARGIARQVIDGGTGSLSEKQAYVYEAEIVPALMSAPPDEELL